jgi:3-oxoacyl-[acyl-carrier protein] reductase
MLAVEAAASMPAWVATAVCLTIVGGGYTETGWMVGQVAVVTGAAQGIGRGCAVALARRGFAVALVDVRRAELAEAADAVRAVGAQALEIESDVASYAAAQRDAKDILAALGRVDVLVNNAGISQPKGLLEISEAEFDHTIAVNMKGQFNWCKALAPAMLTLPEARIVNISSVSAHTGAGFSAVSRFAYCTSKAGVLGLTRGLAKELAPTITVNAICPGAIETALTQAMIDREREPILGSIPLRRLGTPADIAEVVAFLATVTPNFITGEVIDVDGGQWVN